MLSLTENAAKFAYSIAAAGIFFASERVRVLYRVHLRGDSINDAAIRGDVSVLKYYTSFFPTCDEFKNAIVTAAKYAHLEVVKFLAEPRGSEDANEKRKDLKNVLEEAKIKATDNKHNDVVSYIEGYLNRKIVEGNNDNVFFIDYYENIKINTQSNLLDNRTESPDEELSDSSSITSLSFTCSDVTQEFSNVLSSSNVTKSVTRRASC